MKPQKLESTITAWATALAIDQKTLSRNWLKAGFKAPKRGEPLRPKDVFKACTGDWQVARTRQANADADLQELKSRLARNYVIPTDDARVFISTTFSPIRSDVLNLPALYAAKCNPENPELARAVLLEWADTFIARRRENLPTFKIED